jgi:mono/diheme cytochrome c family protein
MFCRPLIAFFAACACFGLAAASLLADEPPAAITPEQKKLFEEKVRPLLVANCYECHGPKKQESGLRLDSRAAVIEGGDSGERAVVPGDPDRSLLVKAVNHVGDYHMPPKRKLADEEIAALTDWVKAGLPWPTVSTPTAEHKQSPIELANHHRQSHWAYQPVQRPSLPQIHHSEFIIHNSIDTFVIDRLQAAGLSPSPPADRRTLIRRLSFDLVGLPPTPDDLDDYLSVSPSLRPSVLPSTEPRGRWANAPDWYERYVDKLLASPRYGERWGRHWLDVARYGDTKGYAFQQERRYPYAYTYRDYVIRTLNEDRPYNDFILEQLAADKLPVTESDKTRLAALGFLTTGRKFNNRNDDIDDQIDAVSRGLLGITVACARCHDHKYDAIPTEDYYSLYGVFASCTEPAELPLISAPSETNDHEASPEYKKFEQGLAKLKDDFEKFKTDKHAEFLDQSRKQAADYLAKIAAGESNALAAKLPFMSLDPKDLRPRLLQRWQQYLDQHAKADDPVLGPWHDLLQVTTADLVEKSQPILARWRTLPPGTNKGQCNPLVQAAFSDDSPAARTDVARIYGKLLTDVYQQWFSAGANDEAIEKLSPECRQIAEILVGKNSPTAVSLDDIRQFLNRADRNKFQELQKKADSFQANSPYAPPRAMVVVDNPTPMEPRVLIRGNPARPGSIVPRQFLMVLAETRQPFADGSGRLGLATAIVSPDNPLTRRVIANRLWMHHFGEPLVLSPSDFGIRCEPPTHPELLDSLASHLLDRDWSLKALHRQMVCSATYRQASVDRADCRAIDPENRLLWRMNRRRLEFEAARDTLLALADRLDTTMFGRAVEVTKSPFPRRRGVYGFIDRQDLPNLYRVFDLASPDSSSPRRPRTTVPQQALFLMNSPFVVEQAQALATRPEIATASRGDEKITALYRLVLNRVPDSDELSIGRDFLSTPASSDGPKLSALEQYAQLLLLTNELMYID